MGPGPGFEGVLARERKLYHFKKSLEPAEAAARKDQGDFGVFSSGVYCLVCLSGDGLSGMTCLGMYRPERLGNGMLSYST